MRSLPGGLFQVARQRPPTGLQITSRKISSLDGRPALGPIGSSPGPDPFSATGHKAFTQRAGFSNPPTFLEARLMLPFRSVKNIYVF